MSVASQARTLSRLDAAVEQLDATTPAAAAAMVRECVEQQDAWRDDVITLLAGEGLMSRGARSLLDSDLASRLSEGLPGDKDPALPTVLHPQIERIEGLLAAAARRLFDARGVEWRPLSNTMANAAVLRATTAPGDTIAVQAMHAGANVSYQEEALAGLLGLRTVRLPGNPDFTIDVEAAEQTIERERPRAIVIGGSKLLFRYPVARLRAAADAVGATLIYDAAHVGPLVAAGLFDAPLADGAHVMTLGTHKLMGGPVGGLVLTDDVSLMQRIADVVYPQLLQTRDLNKVASAAVALLELLEHKHVYGAAIVENAKALATALALRGHVLVGAERGATETHQLFVDHGSGAPAAVEACAANGILLSATGLFGEDSEAGERSGLRISVAQVTRRGMHAEEMRELAGLIDAAVGGVPVGDAVRELARRFPHVRYSFDEDIDAGAETPRRGRDS